MSQLPETLTPADTLLSPETQAVIKAPVNAWGRLFPTLTCLEPYDLEKSTFKLGRTQECDCVLTNDTFLIKKLENISREHFVISKEPGNFVYIKDLSKNGTFINGSKIGRKQKHILENDDEISIGFQELKVFVYKNLLTKTDDFLPSSLQNKYYVSKRLGKGACGEVRLVFDKKTCRPYAIKKIIKAKSSQIYAMNNVNAIKQEIGILRSLDHPFIIPLLDIQESSDAFFIAMEYMAGGQLTDLIDSTRLTEAQVKFFFVQIVTAVQYLHDNGIIHRDLKTDNILLKEKGNINTVIKVSDFGLSKMLEEESMMVTRCGTPHYIAPEVLDSRKPHYDRKVDIWSLGVVLYYMLSQKLPFCVNDTKLLNKLIINGKYEMKEPIWNTISDEAKNLVNSMLTVSPEMRINLEDIPEQSWIQSDSWIQKKVDDLAYGLCNTYAFELDETYIGPDAKRAKLSQSIDDSSS